MKNVNESAGLLQKRLLSEFGNGQKHLNQHHYTANKVNDNPKPHIKVFSAFLENEINIQNQANFETIEATVEFIESYYKNNLLPTVVLQEMQNCIATFDMLKSKHEMIKRISPEYALNPGDILPLINNQQTVNDEYKKLVQAVTFTQKQVLSSKTKRQQTSYLKKLTLYTNKLSLIKFYRESKLLLHPENLGIYKQYIDTLYQHFQVRVS